MKRIIYLSLALATMITFGACHKNNPSPSLITGTWTLHKDIITYYTNGAKTSDSTVMAADTVSGSIQFNNNGTFSSKASYYSMANPSLTAEGAADTGKYTLSGMSLHLSLMPADFSFLTFTAIWGTFGTVSNQVYSTKLNALDGHNLNLENKESYTVTNTGGVTNYETVSDCYYTK